MEIEFFDFGSLDMDFFLKVHTLTLEDALTLVSQPDDIYTVIDILFWLHESDAYVGAIYPTSDHENRLRSRVWIVDENERLMFKLRFHDDLVVCD